MKQEQLRENIIEKSFYLTQAVINRNTFDEVQKLRLVGMLKQLNGY